jgi:dihydroorotate dehydrogenase electron transfer subunit
MTRCQEKAPILRNLRLQGSYYRVDLRAEQMAPAVMPGQFVHVQLPALEHHVLRRPFSVFNVEPATGTLSLIYKTVGEGTAHLAGLGPGACLDLLGPLGHGYSVPLPGRTPIVVAGGYGCAATFLFVRRSPVPCVVLLGGRSAEDLLLVDEFVALGADVRLATNDGSRGHRGVVTDLLAPALEGTPDPFVIACGPTPMLRAVCQLVGSRGLEAEVSLDHAMCCGVGACFACVVKIKADTPDGWEYVRTCRSGPVFPASLIHWETERT